MQFNYSALLSSSYTVITDKVERYLMYSYDDREYIHYTVFQVLKKDKKNLSIQTLYDSDGDNSQNNMQPYLQYLFL